MGKLVVLRLDGDVPQLGFRVTLTIGTDSAIPFCENPGYLPPDPELATYIKDHWQTNYRRLELFYRLNPIKITYEGSINLYIDECQDSASKLGDRLRRWLNSEPFQALDRRLREELSRDEEIRVLIRTKDRQLHKLPWHLWDFFERYSKAEVAFGASVFDPVEQSPTFKEKVKILAILGNSDGIDTEVDRRQLEALPDAEVEFLVEPARHQLNDQLWEQSWDILFFAGHTATEGDRGRIYINSQDSLTIEELRYALKRAISRGLKLAIFNSCDGLGLAYELEQLHIPQMIVMREPVPDRVAQNFLKNFLKAFANGDSLYAAERAARERLQGLEGEFPCASWLPVIFQHPAAVPLTWKDFLNKPTPLPEVPQPESNPQLQFMAVNRRNQPWWRGIQKGIMASLIVTVLVMGGRTLGLWQSFELKAFDQLMQLRPAEPPDPRLLVVQVTQDDITNLGGEYPLEDRTMLRLLRKLEDYQPQVIGIDIFRDRPEGEGREDLVQYLQQSDRVIPICVVPSTSLPEGVASPDGLTEKQLGFTDIVKDSDHAVRRHLLAMLPPASSPCPTRYALSFQLALRYLEDKGISPNYISTEHWQLGSIDFKKLSAHRGFYQREMALRGFQLLLNYRSGQSLDAIAEQVTLTDVFADRINLPELVKNKIILIGMTDPTVKDDLNTPYDQEIRGVFLHAQMVSQLVSAVENERPLLWFLPLWGDTLWVGILSLIGGLFTWRFLFCPVRLGLTVGVAIITLNGFCLIVLLTTGCVLPLVPAGLALVGSSVSILVFRAFNSQDI